MSYARHASRAESCEVVMVVRCCTPSQQARQPLRRAPAALPAMQQGNAMLLRWRPESTGCVCIAGQENVNGAVANQDACADMLPYGKVLANGILTFTTQTGWG